MNLILPIEGIGALPGIGLTQKFGEHQADYGQFGMIGHNGWDISCPKGTPVLAVHDGEIQFLIEDKDYGTGYGKNIRLYFEEDGFTWDCIYGHLDRYEGVPRVVKKGEVIGYADSTGFSTGHHLHFGIRKIKNGVVVDYNNGYFGYIDPSPYFRRTNMKVYIDRRTAPPTVVYGLTVDTPENLIWYGIQTGVDVPLKPDGTVDFDLLTYDGEIK